MNKFVKEIKGTGETIRKGDWIFDILCDCCNNWITAEEDYYYINVPDRVKSKDMVFKSNFCAHVDCWDNFTKSLNEEEIAHKLSTHKKPKRKKLSVEQLENVEIFKDICNSLGFDKIKYTIDKRTIKMKKPKKSMYLTLDTISGLIFCEGGCGDFEEKMTYECRKEFCSRKKYSTSKTEVYLNMPLPRQVLMIKSMLNIK